MSRLAVVFGGSRGIGRAVSQLLAQRGHKVVLLTRNKEAAQVTAESLPGVFIYPKAQRKTFCYQVG
uniref:Carbonyl reductase 4 n=1 Tax=Sinocyclocheilus anshuiensis TaxID=1608454 RepID=A0A671LKG3_9TELE